MNPDFTIKLHELKLNLTEAMLDKFAKYYHFLEQENQVMNLTAIISEEEVYLKHFYDSLSLIKAIPMNRQSVLDVGSGAGFPSIPLKIAYPKLQITIIDSLNKRIGFLRKLTELLELDNVELISGRVEELLAKGKYDIVTARAVAKLNILQELCLPFVKTGGFFVAMKSANYEAELNEALPGILKLGGIIHSIIEYEVLSGVIHVLIVIKKIKPTELTYPRNYSQIKKRPL